MAKTEFNPNSKYRTEQQINAEAQAFDMKFVNDTINYYPPKANDRYNLDGILITDPTKLYELKTNQKNQLIAEYDKFLGNIRNIGLNSTIVTQLEGIKNKPFLPLVAFAESNINFPKIITKLVDARNNPQQQALITEQLYGQLYATSMKGLFREYCSDLNALGLKGKAQTMFGFYKILIEDSALEVNPNSYPEIARTLRDNLNSLEQKAAQGTLTQSVAEDQVMKDKKIMISFTSRFHKDYNPTLQNRAPISGRK